MKKLISLLGLLMLILTSTMFTSCAPEAGEVLVTDEIVLEDMEFDGNDPAQSWAFFTHDLSKYAGKEATFELSADVKVVNNTDAAYGVWFQVNNGSEYPGLHDEDPGKLFEPGESEQTISGTKTISVNNGAVLYLTTHNEKPDVKISVTNFKCKVTYMTSGKPATQKTYPTDIFTVGAAGTCGIQIGDGELEPFQLYEEKSAEKQTDGSMIWTSTASGGGAGGATFYIKSDKTEINIANYESIEIEFVYSPITGKWASKAQNPGFCLRLLPWDSTGLFGGTVDVAYFQDDINTNGYGTCTKTLPISDDLKNQIIASASQDSVVGFGLKFNDYERGNENGDQIKVQLKKVKFNRKPGAPEDKPFDDGLTEAQRGKVVSIEYPTQDYTMESNPAKYNKHAWVYLPAGYDENDKETKYPVFILLHGYGQNENTWGLSNKGRGGRIKGFMDRGMADGSVEKFILVCATGIASQKWGPNGAGTDMEGSNAFGGELRNNLLPYIRENYNVAEGRDNVALAGLSMGGGQTMNIGIGECLDEISYFGAFSAALFRKMDNNFKPLETWEEAIDTYMTNVETAFPDEKINYLYMICGDADTTSIEGVTAYVNYIETNGWDKLGEKGKERFTYTEVPGGTHDFPVWFQGFDEFSRIIFKKK